MTKDTAMTAVDWFMERSSEDVPLTIRFFGGEPLLNTGAMESSAAFASKIAKENGREIRFVISTNGTLLSNKAVEVIKKYNIGVCVSIDGPERVHDRFRRDKKGAGSFAKVKRGVDILLRNGINVSAQAVLTSASGDLLTLVRFLVDDLGFKSVYLGFADYKTKSDFTLSSTKMRELNKNYVETVAKCLSESGSRRFSMSGHDHTLNRLYRHESQFYGCIYHAGINMVYVDPEGNLFPCYRLTGKKEYFGNVLSKIKESDIIRKRLHYANDHVDANRCSSCEFRYICGGTCPANYQMNKARSGCGKRSRMKLNLKLYVDLWENNRDLLRDSYA
jgi:uncharacterized protein